MPEVFYRSLGRRHSTGCDNNPIKCHESIIAVPLLPDAAGSPRDEVVAQVTIIKMAYGNTIYIVTGRPWVNPIGQINLLYIEKLKRNCTQSWLNLLQRVAACSIPIKVANEAQNFHIFHQAGTVIGKSINRHGTSSEPKLFVTSVKSCSGRAPKKVF